MIAALIRWSIATRFLVLLGAILLLVWGAISFANLPIEAYPDVANNYVNIITQWPGRAAEEVEQQVTIPIEIAMTGLPGMTDMRSLNKPGLSLITLVFTDGSKQPISVGVEQLAANLPMNETLAALVLASAPLVLVFLIFQRHIIAGLGAGSVKG